MPLILFVTVKIKPDQRQRFLEVIEDDAVSSVRDEPGCLRFEVLQDEQDENTYYFCEVYRDTAALEAHQQMPHFQRWRQASEQVLAAPAQRIRAQKLFPREA
jgi:autoinducer 2-degrading protein